MDDEPQVRWGAWGPRTRVRVDPATVWTFARALKDPNPLYASEAAARAAGFAGVPVPPTYTFVGAAFDAFPDVQPTGPQPPAPPSHLPSDGYAPAGLYLHGEQHFTYHRWPVVGEVLESRRRTSEPVPKAGRRGTMELTYLETHWTDLEGRPVVTERIVSVYLPGG